MNDDDLISLVRAQRDTVPMTVPVDEIIRRGRAVRNRRLVPGAAAGLAVATGVALAVTALTPPSHNATDQIINQSTTQGASDHAQLNAQLAAWIVSKLPDGNISVTVRQLQDPAGLQRTLRADGVPATVTFDQQPNQACHSYPEGTPGPPGQISSLLKAVFPKPYEVMPTPPAGPPRMVPAGSTPPPLTPKGTPIVIDPSALPSNAGVQLAASPSATAVLLPQLVYASPQCTGK